VLECSAHTTWDCIFYSALNRFRARKQWIAELSVQIWVGFGRDRLSETAKRSGPEPVPSEAEGSGFRDWGTAKDGLKRRWRIVNLLFCEALSLAVWSSDRWHLKIGILCAPDGDGVWAAVGCERMKGELWRVKREVWRVKWEMTSWKGRLSLQTKANAWLFHSSPFTVHSCQLRCYRVLLLILIFAC